MSRTYGARDLSRRKTRSDKGKRKKPKRVSIKYIKRIGNKDSILLWAWEVQPMNYEAYLRWNRRVRHKIKPEVKIPLRGMVVRFPVNYINTQDKFVDSMVNWILREGDFLIMGFSGTPRNKYRVKPVKICRILIKSNEQGLYGRMTHNYRLWRYKFFYKD